MAEEKVRRIFLCRHGQTEANEKGLYCGGEHDSPLTEKGKKQVECLGKALNGYYKFSGTVIIASKLGRAIETAIIIARCLQIEPLISQWEDFRELNLGYWCGKTAEENEKLFPKEYEEWRKNFLKLSFRFPGGESIMEARKRMISSFKKVLNIWLSKENCDDIIIAAHGGTNIIILSEILKIKLNVFVYRAMRQNNACLNIINYCETRRWRPKFQVVLVNSTHHLDIDLNQKQ